MSKDSFLSRILRYLDFRLHALRQQDRQNYLRGQATVDATANFAHEASIANNQADAKAILIGSNCMIHGELLVYRHGGIIELGSYVFLGPGSRIWSAVSVKIGNHVLISHNVNIHDSDSHPSDVEKRRSQMQYILNQRALPDASYGVPEAAVQIGDNAWIGMNAVILKGVSIGRGAIIAAGSVVTRDVEDFTVVAGNPAVLKRKLV